MKPAKIITLYNYFSWTSNSTYIFAFSKAYSLPPFKSSEKSQLISLLESNSPSKKDQSIATYLITEVEATLRT